MLFPLRRSDVSFGGQAGLGGAGVHQGDAAQPELRAALEQSWQSLSRARCALIAVLRLLTLDVFKGNFPAAIDAYQTAIQKQPRLAMAHSNLALAYIAQKELEKAARSLDKALEVCLFLVFFVRYCTLSAITD